MSPVGDDRPSRLAALPVGHLDRSDHEVSSIDARPDPISDASGVLIVVGERDEARSLLQF
jgi:hypothetical protein